MERPELLERLTPLIPPPRAHQVRYHGVLAPCASFRDRIVPGPRRPWEQAGPEVKGPIREPNETPTGTHPSAPKAFGRVGDSETTDSSFAVNPRTQAKRPASALRSAGDSRSADHLDTVADRTRSRRLPWAELLQRVFSVDALRCPRCGVPMHLIAAIDDSRVARKILACLGLPARAPPLGSNTSESAEPVEECWDENPAWLFDQTPPEHADED